MSEESIGKDVAGVVDFTLPVPVSCWDVLLTANTIVTVTAPPNFNRAFFSYSAATNVWVTLDGTAPIVPTTSAASTQELNPAGRQISINGGTTIKMISDTAGYVNIRYDLGQQK